MLLSGRSTASNPKMKMIQTREIIVTLLIVLHAGSGFLSNRAQTRLGKATASKGTIPTLTVCEALSHASEYDGRMVQIRDQVFGTEESASFVGDSCPGVLVTDGKVWPSAITLTMPGQLDTILHPVDFKFDEGSDERLQRKWDHMKDSVGNKCVVMAYTGMFEVFSKAKARKPYRDGWIEFSGFGHLNAAGAQLVLKSADDIVTIPNCHREKNSAPSQK